MPPFPFYFQGAQPVAKSHSAHLTIFQLSPTWCFTPAHCPSPLPFWKQASSLQASSVPLWRSKGILLFRYHWASNCLLIFDQTVKSSRRSVLTMLHTQAKTNTHTLSSAQPSRSAVSDSLRPHESQHARPPCPLPTPRVHSDSRPSSQ